MRRIAAALLALMILGSCAVSLAASPDLNGFFSDALDALSGIDLDRQALTVTLKENGDSEIRIAVQRTDGLTRVVLSQPGGYGFSNLTLEFNREEIWLMAGASGPVYNLKFSDVDSILALTGSQAGVSVDRVRELDYGVLGRALGSLASMVIADGASASVDERGSYSLRLQVSPLNLLRGLDAWITELARRTDWQQAALGFVQVLNGSGMAPDLGVDLSGVTTGADLVRVLEQYRDEQLRPRIQTLTEGGCDASGQLTALLTLDRSGDFASASLEIDGTQILSAAYREDGTTLDVILGGREGVSLAAAGREAVELRRFRPEDEDRSGTWFGTLTQERPGGDAWTLRLRADPYDGGGFHRDYSLALGTHETFTPLSQNANVIDFGSTLQMLVPSLLQ